MTAYVASFVLCGLLAAGGSVWLAVLVVDRIMGEQQ